MTVAGPGYGESKLVTENLLLQARDKSGIDVAICRVGQIAGPVRKEHQGGSWSRNEWLPSVRFFSPSLFFLYLQLLT